MGQYIQKNGKMAGSLPSAGKDAPTASTVRWTPAPPDPDDPDDEYISTYDRYRQVAFDATDDLDAGEDVEDRILAGIAALGDPGKQEKWTESFWNALALADQDDRLEHAVFAASRAALREHVPWVIGETKDAVDYLRREGSTSLADGLEQAMRDTHTHWVFGFREHASLLAGDGPIDPGADADQLRAAWTWLRDEGGDVDRDSGEGWWIPGVHRKILEHPNVPSDVLEDALSNAPQTAEAWDDCDEYDTATWVSAATHRYAPPEDTQRIAGYVLRDIDRETAEACTAADAADIESTERDHLWNWDDRVARRTPALLSHPAVPAHVILPYRNSMWLEAQAGVAGSPHLDRAAALEWAWNETDPTVIGGLYARNDDEVSATLFLRGFRRPG